MKKNMRTGNSESGFGLIEVIIAAAILSIVALGITTLVEDMLRVQKKSNSVAVINNFRTMITAAVQNGLSWEKTVADVAAATGNPSMQCLRDDTSLCANDALADLNLKDSDNGLAYYSATANHGFSYDGKYCTSFPSDACPFRWILQWQAKCPTAAACNSPNVKVTGRLVYTPGAAGILPGGFNPELYKIVITRGANAIRNDAVTVSYVENDKSGETPLAGNCKAAWVKRQLNTVGIDSGNNLLNKSGSSLSTPDQVELRAGTYNCRVQSPAFKSSGNRLRLRSIAGTGFPIVTSSFASASMTGGSANLLIETTLVLNVDTTFVVEQTCTKLPSDADAANAAPYGSVNDNWALGVPAPVVPPVPPPNDYLGTVYTTISCARTS